LDGRYNNFDSYYGNLGKKVIDYYFNNCGIDILKLTEYKADEKEFLQDGLFCEYSYIYNQEDDTLEIYRGLFAERQGLSTKERILNSLEEKKKEYYCNLIMIIDKKKHTKKQVLKAFKKYEDEAESEDYSKIKVYPERDIIPLEIPKNYIQLV